MRTFADIMKDRSKQTDQERLIERQERDKAMRKLKAFMRAQAQDKQCAPAKMHEALRGDLGLVQDKPLVLHESEIWEVVEHAYRIDYLKIWGWTPDATNG